MSRQIILIRHGETEANASGRWQGQSNSELTARGQRQVERLSARLRGLSGDVNLSSDLGRAVATAAAVDGEVATERAWREADVGAWEGLTRPEIEERHPGELAALASGAPVSMGGGETYRSFSERIDLAVSQTLRRIPDGGRAIVVTHSGAIRAVLHRVLGVGGGSRFVPLGRFVNTSLTTIDVGPEGELQLRGFNDATHLGGDHGSVQPDGRRVALIRHGQTEANVEGRWQGRSDGVLTDRGHDQISRLAGWFDGADAIYSSPLARAKTTAQAVADRNGLPVDEHGGLVELDFGSWENQTPDDIRRNHPDMYHSIYVEGTDLPRGGDGESFAQMGERFAAAVAEITEASDAPRIGVVAHGGSIRAYVAGVLGFDFATRHRLAIVANTAVSHVILTGGGPVLIDYNLAPHLER